MSQKFIKIKNKNQRSTAYGKYFARAIYDKTFVGTKQLADFIQTQASVKRSDVSVPMSSPSSTSWVLP